MGSAVIVKVHGKQHIETLAGLRLGDGELDRLI
jgi:hypothetical protein